MLIRNSIFKTRSIQILRRFSTGNVGRYSSNIDKSTTNDQNNINQNTSVKQMSECEIFPSEQSLLDILNNNNTNNTNTNTTTNQNNNQNNNNSEWMDSFEGIGSNPFSKESIDILLAPLNNQDIEVKPDGLLYLPEIKYRRILNRAFKPGGWGIVPRGPHSVINKTLTREYALIVNNRFVSMARGEQDFFSVDGLPTATEGVKSNALMRCCKDLGIASELWDPSFVRKWKVDYAVDVWAVDLRTKQKKKLWRRKDDKLIWPFQEA